jgi:phosphopantothenoylcysteine synthetase/decarboxylase
MTKHITLIVTGSVAAVKTFQLMEQLQNAGYEMDVVVTKAVWEHKFFESSKYKPSDAQLDHLKQHAIAEDDDEKIRAAIVRSEKILVCPASADFISQIAGQTSPLGTLLHTTDKPLFIAPAMNVMMWQHPAVASNVAGLKNAKFLGPVLGKMACGDMGYGRLAEVSDIVGGFENGSQELFAKAQIHASQLPQEMTSQVKNILLMVHHNQDDQAVQCAQSLVNGGFNVQCMLAPEARDAAERLQAITSNPPIWEHYQRDPQGMEHIRLPEQSDAVVVAPTSDKYLSEMAHGASGSLCGCAYLATKKPVIIMSKGSPHIAALRTHGATIVPDMAALQTHLKEKTMTQDLAGKKVLVWAGNPRERVDTFRFYVNDTVMLPSTLNEIRRLQDAGAEVTVLAPAASKLKIDGVMVADTLPDGKKIESARDMLAASASINPDIVLQLAGVSSIACEKPSGSKIQKTGPDKAQLFDVVGNVDVMAKLGALFPNAKVAGYNQYQEWQGDASMKPSVISTEAFAKPAAESEQNPLLQRGGKLKGKRVLVTTARTEETLTTTGDKITNFFSGRQGQAIAKACADLGADVTLISGPTHLPDVNHPNVRTIHTASARQMHQAAMQALEQPTDVFIGAAAVADFGAEHPANVRLKEGERHTLELTENPSIVGGAAKHATKRPRVVVSFAAQSPETIAEYAQQKFHKLGVDLTVANPIGDTTIASRDPSKNQVMLIDGNGIRSLPEMGKDEVAGKLADEVANLLLKAKPITATDPTDSTPGGSPGRTRR